MKLFLHKRSNLFSKTIFTAFVCLLTFLQPVKSQQVVAITQIIDHPSLNEIRQGIIEELRLNGYENGKKIKIIYETAQGKTAIATQIAQQFIGLNPDVIVPISTPSAQAIAKAAQTIPIVFAAVTDPLAAKLVHSLEKPQGNTTGVTDNPPLQKQIDLLIQAVPHLKTLGVLYNPGEINSVSQLEQLKALIAIKNIKLITVPVASSADVQQASKSLVGKVDAIYIGNDNTVVSGLEALIKTCLKNKIPLFASDHDSVKRGALAALAYDQNKIGHQVGKIVVRILKGEKPSSIPVEQAKNITFSHNKKTSIKTGISFDKGLSKVLQ